MKKMNGSSISSHIPGDIISDIMLQLPMKTLLRFKSVCKLWYKIIDDPKFAYMHSKKKKKFSRDDFLLEASSFVSPMEDGYFSFLDLDKSTDTSLCLTRYNNVPRRYSSYDRTDVVGSSNGLLCLRNYEKRKFQIMNPLYSITDTYEVDLPNSQFTNIAPAGFGFDELSHKFKIVCFHGQVTSGSHDQRAVRLSVHEVGIPSTSSWRELSRSLGSWCVQFFYDQSSVFADGCIHWLAYICDLTDYTMYKSIVSFNLTTEEFVINRFGVERLLLESDYVHRLFDFNGCLGVVVWVSDQHSNYGFHGLIRILVLCRDDDNNEEKTKKWIQKFSIKSPLGFTDIVGILQARHILMRDITLAYFTYDTQTGISTLVPELPRILSLLRHQGSLIRPSNLASFCNSV